MVESLAHEVESVPTNTPVGPSSFVNVLLVEDSEADATLIRRWLASVREGEYDVTWVASAEEGLDQLRDSEFDVCLVDYRLGGSNGLDFISALQHTEPALPSILLTGSGSAEVDLQAMKLGATDYLNKNDLSGDSLDRSIRYALERRRSEQALRLAARRDGLTGVHNRTSLYERLDKSIERYQRTNQSLAVVVMDLDGFKAINDTLGHAAGDEVLRTAAERLVDTVRPYDLVARIGGDEFVILVEDLERECGDEVAYGTSVEDQKVEMLLGLGHRITRSVAAPISFAGESMSVNASIGIACCPNDSVDPHRLLRAADKAMFRAKRNGGGVALFDHLLDEEPPVPKSLGTEKTTVGGGYLDIAFQPQVDLQTGDIRGCEALLRWTTSAGRKLSPSECLPIFRREGTLNEIGECVRERAIGQAEAWRRAGIPIGRVAVNVSASELCHPGLPGQIEELVERFTIPFEVELTETEIIPDDLRARSAIARIRGLGARIAIDDFGSGFSSLQRLRSMPCDVIKIDPTFVSNIAYSGQDRAIVDAIVRLAERLGAEVIAEGVETESQRAALVALGVRYGQGFGLCNPMSSRELEEWWLDGGSFLEKLGPAMPNVA